MGSMYNLVNKIDRLQKKFIQSWDRSTKVGPRNKLSSQGCNSLIIKNGRELPMRKMFITRYGLLM